MHQTFVIIINMAIARDCISVQSLYKIYLQIITIIVVVGYVFIFTISCKLFPLVLFLFYIYVQ